MRTGMCGSGGMLHVQVSHSDRLRAVVKLPQRRDSESQEKPALLLRRGSLVHFLQSLQTSCHL